MMIVLSIFSLILIMNFINTWYYFQFSLIFLLIIYLFCKTSNFFCSIFYFLGIDNISYSLILLSLFISSLMMMATPYDKTYNSGYFCVLILVLCLVLILIFSSMNMLMMYFFFEFSLVPLMLMIFGWGYQPERLISSLYLFFYTLFASLPLLLTLLMIYILFGFNFFDMSFLLDNFYIYMSMIFAFLVKLPMFMLHFWLPSAHVQAPVSGSMILAGLLLKIGGYGIIRFMFFFEGMFMFYGFIWFSISALGSILVSLICFMQGDVKCMIAYSSVAHMGMCLMSLMTMTKFGVFGAIMLMISHGICSSALFALANISYDRYSSRSFLINKGLMSFMPSTCLFWFIFCSSNMSCPPSLNFISEVFIICSMFNYWSTTFYFFFFISLFSSCFSYYLFSYTQHGNFHNMYSSSLGLVREYLMLSSHLIPIYLIIFMLNYIYI
nr:NADH dehydrogenase subunit 4 [Sobrala sp. SL-2021a]